MCGPCVGNDRIVKALSPLHALPGKNQSRPRLGPGAYARQPIASVRKDKTTAKIIPLSVSIVCAPVVDSQTIARLAISVNKSFALNVRYNAAMVNS